MNATTIRRLCATSFALTVSLSLFACGTETAQPGPTPTPAGAEVPEVLALSPETIDADFEGTVTISGANFDANPEVLINGAPAIAIPAIGVNVISDRQIEVSVSYPGPGQKLASGEFSVSVRNDAGDSNARTLEVLPVLLDVEHILSAPRGFTPSGGAFDIWVRPLDSDDEFIGTSHPLAANGLDWSHFQLTNLSVTRVVDAMPVDPDLFGVANVVFQPRGDESPLAVALTIDQSGSLIGLGSNPVPSDPDDRRIDGSQMFVDSMGTKDQAAVIKFQCPCPGGSQVVQDLTSDKDVLKTALDGLRDTEGGNTPLYEAIGLSLDVLDASEGMSAKAVIVLTDGRNTVEGPTPAELVTKATDYGIPVFTIGLGNPNDPDSLDRDELEFISSSTGGRFFFAEDADALDSIFATLTALLEDSYRVEAAVSFEPALGTAGVYEVEGDLVTRVGGREVVLPLDPFTVSVVD